MISNNKSLQSGFSLVELMISLVIILGIIGMIAPSFARILFKGKEASTKNTMTTIRQAITEYKNDVNRLPDTLMDLDKKPEGVTGWAGSYLPEKWQGKEEIEDAWGQPLEYKVNPRGTKPPYVLRSLGDPDKEDAFIELE